MWCKSALSLSRYWGVGSITNWGGGHRLPGALLKVKTSPKKYFPEKLTTGGGGTGETFSGHTTFHA